MSEKRVPWSVSATEAQNNFGRVLGKVAEDGVVYITKYDRPQAVVISVERYEALVGDSDPDLEEMEREFDAMFEAMQTPEAAAAGDLLFAMEGEALGAAALRGRGAEGRATVVRGRAEILVLAGADGAGKSSVAGEALREASDGYFDPDEVAAAYSRRMPAASREEASGWAAPRAAPARTSDRETSPLRVRDDSGR